MKAESLFAELRYMPFLRFVKRSCPLGFGRLYGRVLFHPVTRGVNNKVPRTRRDSASATRSFIDRPRRRPSGAGDIGKREAQAKRKSFGSHLCAKPYGSNEIFHKRDTSHLPYMYAPAMISSAVSMKLAFLMYAQLCQIVKRR